MGKREGERPELNASGLVEITETEFREYQDLLKGRDNLVDALQEKAREQEAAGRKLVQELVNAINLEYDGDYIDFEHNAREELRTAYEHATAFLAGDE